MPTSQSSSGCAVTGTPSTYGVRGRAAVDRPFGAGAAHGRRADAVVAGAVHGLDPEAAGRARAGGADAPPAPAAAALEDDAGAANARALPAQPPRDRAPVPRRAQPAREGGDRRAGGAGAARATAADRAR